MSIQLKRCTSTGRQSSSTVLKAGQPLYDMTNNKLYMGDGSKAIKELTPVVAERLYNDMGQISIGGPSIQARSMSLDMNGSSDVTITSMNGNSGPQSKIYMSNGEINLRSTGNIELVYNDSNKFGMNSMGIQFDSQIDIGQEAYTSPAYAKGTHIADNALYMRGVTTTSDGANFRIENSTTGVTTIQSDNQLILKSDINPVTVNNVLRIEDASYKFAQIDNSYLWVVDGSQSINNKLTWPSKSGTFACLEDMPYRHVGYFTISDKTDSNLMFGFAVDKVCSADEIKILNSAYSELSNITELTVSGNISLYLSATIDNCIKCVSAVWIYTGQIIVIGVKVNGMQLTVNYYKKATSATEWTLSSSTWNFATDKEDGYMSQNTQLK